MPGAGPAVVQVAAALQQLRSELQVLWNRYHSQADSQPITHAGIVNLDETRMTPYKAIDSLALVQGRAAAKNEEAVAALKTHLSEVDQRCFALSDEVSSHDASIKTLDGEVKRVDTARRTGDDALSLRARAVEEGVAQAREGLASLELNLSAMIDSRLAPVLTIAEDMESLREGLEGVGHKCGERFKNYLEFRTGVRDTIDGVARIEGNLGKLEREVEVKLRESRAAVERIADKCEFIKDTAKLNNQALESNLQRDMERLKAELFLVVQEAPNYARVTEARFFALEQRLKTEENYRISEQTGTDTILGEVVKVVDKQSRKLEGKAAKRDVQNLEGILQPLCEQIIAKLLFSSQAKMQGPFRVDTGTPQPPPGPHIHTKPVAPSPRRPNSSSSSRALSSSSPTKEYQEGSLEPALARQWAALASAPPPQQPHFPPIEKK